MSSAVPSLFDSIYRDYVTPDVPSSGAYEPPKIDIRALGQTIGYELDAALPDALAAAEAAEAAQAAAEAAAAAAAIGYMSFATTAEMEAFTTATEAQTAYNAETDSYYAWDDGGSEWVFVRLAETTQIAALDTRVDTLEETVGDHPTGINSESLVVRNAGGWILDILDLDSGDDVTETETEARVEAIHGNDVETAPLLVGKNVLMSWGESKAIPAGFMKTYFDQLYASEVGSYPAGVETESAIYNLGGQTMADQLTPTQLALMRTELDDAITAGGEAFSAWALVEQANDILQRTTPDAWEASIRTALEIIRRDSLQRYVGTDPDALVPAPPVFMMAETGAWAANELSPDIMLRGNDLSREIYGLGVSHPDYVWQFSGDNLHGTTHDTHISAAYTALAMFYWRALNKKYHPTQVREWWFDGGDAYLRCEMPTPPLVIGTELVSAITNEGIDAYDASGAAITVTGVSIVGGGRIIKVEQAGNWVAGDIIRGALFGTSPNTSGRVTGPRSTIHDSSTETVTILGNPFQLYSPLLPFRITL